MGGRGSSNPGGGGGNSGWKKQLKSFANRGEMPAYIGGNREQQSEVFKEIDKLYKMPETNARIIDQGSSVWVQVDGKVYRQGYPTGETASESEKRGVLKKILYNHKKR